MPKGPNGEYRPADVAQRVVRMGRIFTGEIEEALPSEAAVQRGQAGGKARASKLSPERRQEIALNANRARHSSR